jgi:hypothetical protein
LPKFGSSSPSASVTARPHSPLTVTVTRRIAFSAAGRVGAAALTTSSSETPVSLWVREPHHHRSVVVNDICGSLLWPGLVA